MSVDNKKNKREREMSLIIEEMRAQLGGRTDPFILEFGTGMGFQVPFLSKIGRVVASDLYDRRLPENRTGDFRACSITQTPFQDGEFDILFSNHVIEHIDGLEAAFPEMRRIGKPDCIYAFSTPTNVWLLFSVPAQYYNKLKGFARRFAPKKGTGETSQQASSSDTPRSFASRLRYFLLPNGHGHYRGFVEAYRMFRIKNWRRLYEKNGFEVIAIKPLFLYAPSEFPIIPMMRFPSKYLGVCSSVLFILKKRGPTT